MGLYHPKEIISVTPDFWCPPIGNIAYKDPPDFLLLVVMVEVVVEVVVEVMVVVLEVMVIVRWW